MERQCTRILIWFMIFTILPFCSGYSVGAKIQQSAGCYHNGTIYAERSLIPTIEPCLTCRCANKSLVCALKVCPEQVFPPPRGCVLVQPKRACCPYLSCKTFRHGGGLQNELGTRLDGFGYGSSNNDEFGSNNDLLRSDDIDLFEENNVCIEDGSVYGSGSAMVSSNFCSYCYCFAGKRVCVQPKCVLPNNKCRPIYANGSCCPVHYDCDERNATTVTAGDTDENSKNSVTFDMIPVNRNFLKKTKVSDKQMKCFEHNTYYFDGQKLPPNKENPCEMCFCIRGNIMCTPKKCAPYIGNCIPIIPDGECCAIGYECRSRTNETTRHFRQDDSDDFDLFSLLFGPEKVTENVTETTPSPTTTSKKGILDTFFSLLGTSDEDNSTSTETESIPPFKRLTTETQTSRTEMPSTTTEIPEISTVWSTEVKTTTDGTTDEAKTTVISTTDQQTTITEKSVDITEIIATEINTITNVPENFVNQSTVTTKQPPRTRITTTTTTRTRAPPTTTKPTLIPFRPLKTNSSTNSLLTALLNMFEKSKVTPQAIITTRTTKTTTTTTKPKTKSTSTTARNSVTYHHQLSNHHQMQSNPSILETDYNYDYDEPTLPPSLPNLHIIPFVPDDAVELRTEDLEKYPSITEQTSSSIDRYDDVDKIDFKDIIENPYDYQHWKNYYFGASHPQQQQQQQQQQRVDELERFSPPLQIEGGFVPKEPTMKLENLYITTSVPMRHKVKNPSSASSSDIYEKTVEIAYGVHPKPFSKAEIEVVPSMAGAAAAVASQQMTTERKPTPPSATPWETDVKPPPFKSVPEALQIVSGNRRIADYLVPEVVKNDLHIGEILVGHNLADYKTSSETIAAVTSSLSSTTPEILGKPSTNPLDTLLRLGGCNIYGEMYNVGSVIDELSDGCSECKCTEVGVQCNYSGCK